VDSDADFLEALASALVQVGDTSAAREVATEATQKWPKRTAAHVALAQIALAEDKPQHALDALAKAGEIAKSPLAMAARGRAYLAAGKLEEAQQDLDAALAARPNLREALIARAMLDLQRDEPAAAMSKLESLYSPSAESELAIAYATALRRSGKLDVARGVIQKILSGPGGARAYVELGRIERDSGEHVAAGEAYQRAIEMAPNAIEPRLEAATLRLDSGDAVGARESLDHLAQTDAPDSGLVLIETARVHTLTGDPVGAGALLERAGKLSSAPGWALARERGRQLIASGKHADAISELARAKSLKPTDREIRMLLLEAHALSNNKSGLREETEDIAKNFRGSALQRMARGRSAALNERWVDAIEHYAEALAELRKERATPRQLAEAELWLARAHQKKGSLDKAEEVLRSATKRDPSSGPAFFLLGEVRFEQQKTKEALVLYEKSVELDPSNPTAWYYIGEAYAERKGKPAQDRAKQALVKYLELSPDGPYAEDAKAILGRL
jgi:tetratricopeptide (TPR) repeat protein